MDKSIVTNELINRVIGVLNHPYPATSLEKAILIQELQKSEPYEEKKDGKTKT